MNYSGARKPFSAWDLYIPSILADVVKDDEKK
jgi:hypothetical protein